MMFFLVGFEKPLACIPKVGSVVVDSHPGRAHALYLQATSLLCLLQLH